MLAVGVAAMGAVNVALRDFDPTQPVSAGFPARAALALSAAVFLFVAGAALAWPRLRRAAAAALTLYFALVVVLLMNGRVLLHHASEYGGWFGAVEGLALAAASALVWMASRASSGVSAAQPAASQARAIRVAQIVFGLCALYFGGAHFVYPAATVPLVPAWLPPSASFWAYATGVFHIAGGLAIIAGVVPRLAALLLAAMYTCFTPLVHLPLLFSDPGKAFYWTENALNLALVGVAWVVADSFLMLPRWSRRG